MTTDSQTIIDQITTFLSPIFVLNLPPREERDHVSQVLKSVNDTKLKVEIDKIKEVLDEQNKTKIQRVDDAVCRQMEIVCDVYNNIKKIREERKRKSDQLYEITRPKNLKLEPKFRPTHIYDWEPQPRGYGVVFSGEAYAEGKIGEILRKTTKDFGFMPKFNQGPSSAFASFESIVKRQVAIEAVLEAEPTMKYEVTNYRQPIIKINLVMEEGFKDWNEVVLELKEFNLKRYLKNKFELFKVYKIKTLPYTSVCILVDPLIRDYISEEGQGRLFFRGRKLEVLDFFQITKCFDCGNLGHFRCNKGKQRRCLRCSGPHKRNACTSQAIICPACRGPHEAFHISCPAVQKEIQNDMNNIDYVYTNIMWSTYA